MHFSHSWTMSEELNQKREDVGVDVKKVFYRSTLFQIIVIGMYVFNLDHTYFVCSLQ